MAEFNRADSALNVIRARINPLLLRSCEHSYRSIIQSSDQLKSFQENFNSLPRAVLEFSSRDQLLPEAEVSILHNRLLDMESKLQTFCFSLSRVSEIVYRFSKS